MNEQQLQLEPYFDRIFVKRDDTIEKTAHGVILPDSDKEKPSRGKVIAAGPDCKMAWKGQYIIWGQHHGFEIQIGAEEVTVLREGDIYAGEKRDLFEGLSSDQIGEILTNKNPIKLSPDQRKELLENILEFKKQPIQFSKGHQEAGNGN